MVNTKVKGFTGEESKKSRRVLWELKNARDRAHEAIQRGALPWGRCRHRKNSLPVREGAPLLRSFHVYSTPAFGFYDCV